MRAKPKTKRDLERKTNLYSTLSDLFPNLTKQAPNHSAVLEAFVAFLHQNPFIDQLLESLYRTVGESDGLNPLFIGRVYDTRTGTVEVFALKQRNLQVDWKEAIRALSPKTAPKHRQNVVRIRICPTVTKQHIAAGRPVQTLLDTVEIDGWFPDFERPPFELLESAFDNLGWHTYVA